MARVIDQFCFLMLTEWLVILTTNKLHNDKTPQLTKGVQQI